MAKVSTCYMCDSVETTREHAPPLCFFPVSKDVGRDLRSNLITVPSCDLHNSNKSKDDEFLRSVILMSAAKTSNVGLQLFSGPLLRATSRRPHAFRSFFTDKGTVSKGKERALQIDRKRFDRCIDHLVRAIFFDSFRFKWQLPISIVCPNFFSGTSSDQMIPHEPTMNAVEVSRQWLGGEPNRGENPEVFQYRIRYDEADEAYAFAAIFYDSFEIFNFSSKEIVNSAV